MHDIPISKPSIGSREIAYVTDAVTSGWVSSLGGYITQFEQKFAEFCGVKHAVATSNGTVALHLALVALGAGAGDEVIVPDLTFVATANAVVHAGATPVFVDVDPVNFCIDPNAIVKAITPRTKGIIPVHVYGYPANMPEIMRIASEHGLFVLEDAAEAHGAKFAGKAIGSWGDAAAFSFYGNKIITTGEGGCVTTDDSELLERLLYLRDHAMSRERRYWHTEIGFNYRMTNLQAALGVAQLERIGDFILERDTILSWYRHCLERSASSGLSLNPVGADANPVCWMVCLSHADWDYATRDAFILALKRQGIDSRPFFHPVSDFPMYSQACTPNAHRAARRGVNLPCFIGITENEVENICGAVLRIIRMNGAPFA